MTLTPQQINDFERDGFLVVPDVVDADCIKSVKQAYKKRVDDIVQRSSRLGDIPIPNDTADFQEKITTLICNSPQHYQHLDISLPMITDLVSEKQQWQRLFGDDWQEQAGFFGDNAVFNLLTHPNIIAIARQIVGNAICLSPVQHVRIKPPQKLIPQKFLNDANIARTLWHQDEAVVTEKARVSPILTVWLAITDANIENGCMNAIAGSHKNYSSDHDFGLVKHCPGQPVSEIYIPEEAIDHQRLIPLIARAGSAVLLHRRTVHGAGANQSDYLRWSFDLRYQPTGDPSGRDCFPSFVVSGDNPIKDGHTYRQTWLQARDDILAGRIQASFNDRWNKYNGVGLCA